MQGDEMDNLSFSQYDFQDGDLQQSQSPLGVPSFLQPGAHPLAFQDGFTPRSSVLDTGYTAQVIPPAQHNTPAFATRAASPENHDDDTQPLSEPETVPPTAIRQPAKPRKRKAPTRSAATWEPYKARILELHIKEGRPLREVKNIVEREFNFTAEIRQYRFRISQWGSDKNVKPQEMKAIVRKRQRRQVVETDKKDLTFTVRGEKVGPQKIDRFMKRNGISQSLQYSPSSVASTPTAVICRTVSNNGTPYASSSCPPGTPGLREPSIAQSPAAVSPIPSYSSFLLHRGSTFTGESPAPFSQPIPHLDETVTTVSAMELLPSLQPTVAESDISTQAFVFVRYKQADEEKLRDDLQSSRQLHGTTHPYTLRTMLDLGVVLIDQGRYRSAETLLRESLSAARGGNDTDGTSIINISNLLGNVLNRQGRYAEAEILLQQTLDLRESSISSDNHSVLESMRRLAYLFHNQGRNDEAEQMHRQTLQLSEKVLGKEHPDTLSSMYGLAKTLNNQGKYDEAEKMHREELQLLEKVLGKEHPDTLRSMYGLAKTLNNQGKYDEAEKMHREELQLLEKVLGKEHPDTLSSMYGLAEVLNNQGKYDEAEKMHREELQLSEKVLGKEHPGTLSGMYGLAKTLNSQGKYDEAEKMHREELQLSEKVLGKEHPDTLSSMYGLAKTLNNQGKYDEAEKMHREELQLAEKVLGKEHPYMLLSMKGLAKVLNNQGKHDVVE